MSLPLGLRRVLRDVTVLPETVVIGEEPAGRIAAPGAPRRVRVSRPPPPPPPPPPEEPEFVETTWPTWGAEASPQPVAWDEGAAASEMPSPFGLPSLDQEDGEAASEKLEEAEQLLTDARAEANETLDAAQREAETLRQTLRQQAQEELEQARSEAARVRDEAQAEIEQLKADAHEQGLAEGQHEGFEHGRTEALARVEEETAAKLAVVTQLAESAAIDRRELLHNAEAEVVKLAIRIARKILGREVDTDPKVVTRIAEAALQHVTVDGMVKLRVNPEDHAVLTDYWAHNHGASEAERSYEVVADPEVARGGVLIDTRAGSIDAQLETQLEEIAAHLTSSREAEGEGEARDAPVPERAQPRASAADASAAPAREPAPPTVAAAPPATASAPATSPVAPVQPTRVAASSSAESPAAAPQDVPDGAAHAASASSPGPSSGSDAAVENAPAAADVEPVADGHELVPLAEVVSEAAGDAKDGVVAGAATGDGEGAAAGDGSADEEGAVADAGGADGQDETPAQAGA